MNKFNIIFFVLILTVFSSCQSNVRRSNQQEKYYNLYGSIFQQEKELYNYVANICRKTLIKYVDETFPSYPDLIGLLLELDVKGHKKIFQEIMNSKVLRGWSVFDNDMIPLTQEDVEKINISVADQSLATAPKAKYYIKINDNSAIAYVSYWIQQYKTYNYIYYFDKNLNWQLTKTEVIE